MSAKQMIAGFEVQELLGAGGIGQVHAAIDPSLGREVAIKSLRPELVSDASFVDRFRAEAVNLARLNHPNVATLFSLVSEGSNLFMVMELVRGKSLEEVLEARKTALGIRESIAIIAQAAEGLAYAHEMGVIHRDIKPANLMVTSSGRVKIMDFGIARLQGSQRLTRDGSIVGTLAYISPEQLKGAEGDQRSDLYSLGIVFYELLTGKPPFEAASDYDLIQAHVTKAPPRLDVPDLPPEVEAAIMKALAKKPESRFQSVAEFSAALGAHDIRLNATSVIRSSEALINGAPTGEFAAASRTSSRSKTDVIATLKDKFFALPLEMRGGVIGAGAALILGAVLVLPPLLRSSPAPVPTAQVASNQAARQPSVPIPVAPAPAPLISAPVNLPPPVNVIQPSAAPAPSPSFQANRNFPLDSPAVPPAINLDQPTSQGTSGSQIASSSAPPSPPADAPAPRPQLETLQKAIADQDFTAAFPLATRLAESGNIEAQFILGNLYRSGRGVRLSYPSAAHWYERAAEKKHIRAAFNLGLLHHLHLMSGDRRQNEINAVSYFTQAADLGFGDAHNMLGLYLEEGRGGLARDRRKAIDQYQKAADQNNEDAKKRLKALGVN